ncbi:DUF2852 domain-containing protein [Hyphomicrobium sp.]|uniref:DUF2852 domain-containing protein n=1 Tax=Hyphomicrobium sp. TaxID=82 RepID=UPI003F7287B4
MPRHMMMWLLAGGGTLVGASMAYVATRPALAPSAARARAGLQHIRSAFPSLPNIFMSSALGERSRRGQTSVTATESTTTRRSDTESAAFDAYRSVELAKLDEQERDFQAYLSGLRMARDRQEFNVFLDNRRERGGVANKE